LADDIEPEFTSPLLEPHEFLGVSHLDGVSNQR
jgi:hypothetical protein